MTTATIARITTEIKILGVTDEVTTCDWCGKTHLAKTIAVEVDGQVQYWGCECVKRVHVFLNSTRDAIYREIEEETGVIQPSYANTVKRLRKLATELFETPDGYREFLKTDEVLARLTREFENDSRWYRASWREEDAIREEYAERRKERRHAVIGDAFAARYNYYPEGFEITNAITAWQKAGK